MYLEIVLKKVNDVPGKSTVAFFDVGDVTAGRRIFDHHISVASRRGFFVFESAESDVKDKTRVSLRIKDVAIPKEYIINR